MGNVKNKKSVCILIRNVPEDYSLPETCDVLNMLVPSDIVFTGDKGWLKWQEGMPEEYQEHYIVNLPR